MAGSETKKETLALRAFRRAAGVTLELPGGGTVRGKGFIFPLAQNAGNAGGERHSLGVLSRPLSRFVGFLPEWEKAVGGLASQGGAAYAVMDARPILLGERLVCVRLLLERRDELAGDRTAERTSQPV